MNILKKISEIKTKTPLSEQLRDVFDFLLTQIENNKGDLQLVHIFELISNELQKNKINSIICIINNKGNEITVRHINFPGEFKYFFTTEIIKKIGFQNFSKYQEVIKTKKTIYNENRLKQFVAIIPQTGEIFKKTKETNSILSPLILRGEIIGTLEILSPQLEQKDLRIVERFIRKLVISITNNILFHEIRESEKRYRELFENSSDAMRKLSGYSTEELKQLYFLRLFDKHDQRKISENINLIKDNKQTGLPKMLCVKIVTKNKKTKISRIELGTQIDKDEICFNIHDITESKLAEEENIKLKEFNQKIVDSSPVSILVLNKKGKIILVNNMAQTLMHKPKEKILGEELCETREIKNNKELLFSYKNLLNKGKAFHYDNLSYILKTDKKQRYLNIIAVPLYTKDKIVSGGISMAIDNTEKIMAKKKLEELNKKLEVTVEKRTKELDIINKELSKVLELKLKFISDASHELRTPLTIIQGNLDLAIQENLNDQKEIPEAYTLIEKEVEQMTGILTDLTMLTNADASSETIDCDDIDLNLLIKTVGQSLEILADKKGIKIKTINKNKKIKMKGDEAKLEKLFLNIIRNAIKYTEKDGEIELTVKREVNIAKVIVKDTGMGIPDQDLPYIFERFYRVDKARSRAEGGTGLGLSICKWIAEAHGGKIQAESKLGIGSVFTISLPCECLHEKEE